MSAPIPIAPKRAVPVPRQRSGVASASVPAAPLIGSLPPPSALSVDMPDLSLPPPSPEAFSLAAIATAETTQRLVGVSSAPARTFIENARRAGSLSGTSPTVLGLLQQRGVDDTARRNVPSTQGVDKLAGGLSKWSLKDGAPSDKARGAVEFGKIPGGTGPGPAASSSMVEGGLAAALKRGPATGAGSGFNAHSSGSSGSSSGGGGGYGGERVVLATSFRDPAHMPPPLPDDIAEADEEDSSDEEYNGGRGAAAAGRVQMIGAGLRAGGGRRAPDSDDEEVLREGKDGEEEEEEEEEEEGPGVGGRLARVGGRAGGARPVRPAAASHDEGVFDSDV